MYFMIFSEDKTDSLDIRTTNREAHLLWLKKSSGVTLKIAGPWMDNDGIMRGSLLIVEADRKETVIAWLKHDPYRSAGLTETVHVKAYNWVIGNPDNS